MNPLINPKTRFRVKHGMTGTRHPEQTIHQPEQTNRHPEQTNCHPELDSGSKNKIPCQAQAPT